MLFKFTLTGKINYSGKKKFSSYIFLIAELIISLFYLMSYFFEKDGENLISIVVILRVSK